MGLQTGGFTTKNGDITTDKMDNHDDYPIFITLNSWFGVVSLFHSGIIAIIECKQIFWDILNHLWNLVTLRYKRHCSVEATMEFANPAANLLQKTRLPVWILATITPTHLPFCWCLLPPGSRWQTSLPTTLLRRACMPSTLDCRPWRWVRFCCRGSRTCRRRALEHIWQWVTWEPAQNTSPICFLFFKVQRQISIWSKMGQPTAHTKRSWTARRWVDNTISWSRHPIV